MKAMKGIKRAVCILLAVTMLTAVCGCGKKESGITEVRVTLPESTGSKAIVEGEAVLTTQLYLLARAYLEKLAAYDTDSFDAQEYSDLLAETEEALRIAEIFGTSLENHAGILAEVEEKGTAPQQKAGYEVVSFAAEDAVCSPLLPVVYAAEKESPAVQYAKEITKTFDEARNGQKLKTLAQQYGTDVKKAKVMLEQAQAILEGAAYTDQAAFENRCYKLAVETKAAATNLGFGLSVIATGGTAAGIMEVCGIVCGGLQAIIDTGTAASIHVTNGEGNGCTEFFEKADGVLAPVSAIFSIGSGWQNIADIRNPKKAAEVVDNAAQAFLTGIGFARDYVQDDKVLGVSTKMVEGYREIILYAADASDKAAAKEVLTRTGVSPEALEDTEPAQEFSADAYIETMGDLIDPANPVDAEAFIENIDTALRLCAEGEGVEASETEPVQTEEAGSPQEETAETAEENTETAPEGGKTDGSALTAAQAAGSYYFAELEDSAEMTVEAVDETHLKVTDVHFGESISGEYDAATGVFVSVLSEQFSWTVTIVFTDTGSGIRADYTNAVGEMVTAASSMKQ